MVLIYISNSVYIEVTEGGKGYKRRPDGRSFFRSMEGKWRTLIHVTTGRAGCLWPEISKPRDVKANINSCQTLAEAPI